MTRLDRVFLGLVSFEVKKDVTYWLLSPTSQFGFYGFKLYVGGTLDDVEDATAISTAKVDNITPNAPLFNLAGQEVSKSYKGVVIQNGKKMVLK